MKSSQQITMWMQDVDELLRLASGTIYIVASVEQTENYVYFYINVTAVTVLNHVLLYRYNTGSSMKGMDTVKEEGVRLDTKLEEVYKYLTTKASDVARGVINPEKPMDGHPFKPKS